MLGIAGRDLESIHFSCACMQPDVQAAAQVRVGMDAAAEIAGEHTKAYVSLPHSELRRPSKKCF